MRFLDIIYTLPGTLIRGLSGLLFLGGLFVCQHMIHLRRRPLIIFLSVGNALVSSLLFAILMGDKDRIVYGASLRFHEFELLTYQLPWWAFLAMEAWMALLLLLFAWDIRRYSRQHVTTDTIKEAVDLLPTGICFGNEKGEALLFNIRMNHACLALTGRILQDTRDFWEAVTRQGEEQDGQYLVHAKNGTALLFSKTAVSMEDKAYTQFIATDMTEPAKIQADLRARNAELWDVQYRMKAYQTRAAEMFLEEELLTARAEVHDELGHLLLMGRYYLDHPEKTDEEELLRMMRQSSTSLMAEAEALPESQDSYEESLRRTLRIGVQVDIQGTVPPTGEARRLIGQALGECAANAMKHAGGHCVRMVLTDLGGWLQVTLTNDGEAPCEPVREIGGLRTLRRMTEDAGGRMTLESSPRFQLHLLLPKEEP